MAKTMYTDSLKRLMLMASQEQSFIKNFVLSQGPGYSHGWDLRRGHFEIDQWMSIKVLFNYDIACMIRDCWKKRQALVPQCVKSVGHDGWLALKDQHDKWGIIELPSQKEITGFPKI